MADERVHGTATPSPPPCAKGCGFFGSASTMNMCSKCYREHQRSAQQADADMPPQAEQSPAPPLATPIAASFSTPLMRAAPPAAVVSPAASVPVLAPPGTPEQTLATAVATPATPAPRKVQKNTSRCWTCRKKIGLTGFKCRCGYFYCSAHRYADVHDCDFDYQATAREQLEKANPVVVASKLEKI